MAESLKFKHLHLFILINLAACIFGDSCELKETCSSCIRSLGCAWCSQTVESSNNTLARCKSTTLITETWCPPDHIFNPESQSKTLANDDVRTGADPIQIQPQRIKLTLRQGEEKKFDFIYQQAEDYPVDLYYLMDLSASMADDKDSLSALGDKLARVMKNLTNNFHLGFGSFVDKPEMPYVSTMPHKLKSPCTVPGTTNPCAPPYSYINHMSLTKETEPFSENVKKAEVSGNLDYPEGGLDAIMQALVCTKEIGWRSKARKLLLFSTDAGFHLAGDGKLAGIIEPNDEQCHLDSKGFYTHALMYDYPSISQIDKQARENNINIIFAVTEKQAKVYKLLRDHVHGAAHGSLTKDSSNIVDLVKTEYEKLMNAIAITDNAGGSVQIQYYSKCLSDETKQTNECGNIRGRPKIRFTAAIKALDCPTNKTQWKQTIEIRPGNLDERLTIDLEVICQCPCEQASGSGFEANSTRCNGYGNFQCGICTCASDRYGRFCECDGSQAGATPDDSKTNNCRAEANEEICSGLGFCKCGKCDCTQRSGDEVVYGTFCECNNYSCKRNAGALCSDHGRCDCGKCICQSGWSGLACECRENNATCIEPGSVELCSGHGKCECGACQCSLDDKFRYSGKYCQECPHCTGDRCDELAPCVECQVYKSGSYDEIECMHKCSTFFTEVVEKIDTKIDDSDETNTERICRVPDNAGCSVLFKYNIIYGEGNMTLKVQGQKTKECPKEIDMMAVIFGVVGSTVLIGLAVIIVWKIMTTIHDKREYERFEIEKNKAKFDRGDNPLYKPSTTQFNNPAFSSSQK